MGSTAILSINGTADTTAAQAQLDSFIEKWKGQHVNAIFLSGDEVSSKQFVTKIRQEMPKVMLMTRHDATSATPRSRRSTRGSSRTRTRGSSPPAGRRRPSTTRARTGSTARRSTRSTRGRAAPKSTTVIKGPGGKTLDTYGSINDACQIMTMFHDIATKAGQEPEQRQLGQGGRQLRRDHEPGSGPYSSLHTGKYDVEDTFRLQEFDSSIKPSGDWKAITPVENVTGQ